MLKKLCSLVKKIIIGFLFIYAYNIIVFPINAVIPINIFTVLLVIFFGFPALIAISLFPFLF